MEWITHSPAETEALGARLADALDAGRVVAFTGDLGAGKTAFVSGMARALGVEERVTSPTFTIVNEYEGGRLPLFHFDMYRLGTPTSCSTSAGRTTWPGAASVPWSGARTWPRPWSRTPSGCPSSGGTGTATG